MVRLTVPQADLFQSLSQCFPHISLSSCLSRTYFHISCQNHVWALLALWQWKQQKWSTCIFIERTRVLRVLCCFHLHRFVCRFKPHFGWNYFKLERLLPQRPLEETVTAVLCCETWTQASARWDFHSKTTNCSGAWKPNCSM